MGIGYGFRGRVSVRRQNIQFVQYKTLLRLWRVPTKRVNQTCELYVSERVRERERERERERHNRRIWSLCCGSSIRMDYTMMSDE